MVQFHDNAVPARTLSWCTVYAGLVASYLAVASGCTSYGRWRDSQEPSGLVAGQIAKSVERTGTGTFWWDPMAGIPFTQFAWADARGNKYKLRQIAFDVAHFIKQTTIYSAWPGTNSYVNGVQKRLAPFRFTLVSIKPTIVIMQPRDYGKLDRSTAEIVGEREHAFYLPGLSNPLYYGAQLPSSTEIWWLSPDLNRPPQRLLLPEGSSVVEIREGQLHMVRSPEGWRVEPTAR